jgi:hypothetical protein
LQASEIAALEVSFAGHYQNKVQSESLLQQLTDGGNTPLLKQEVEQANAQQTWALRSELLGTAPHVSETVLRQAAENTTALPEAILVEILEANPDALRNEDFLRFLEEKSSPLPSYIIDSLRSKGTIETARTVLINTLNHHDREMKNIANQLIVHYLNDSSETAEASLMLWYANRMDLAGDLALARLLAKNNNVQDAVALLANAASVYQLPADEEEKVSRFVEVMELEAGLSNENSAQTIEALHNLAANRDDYAAVAARGIIGRLTGAVYVPPIVLPDAQQRKPALAKNKKTNRAMQGGLSVTPNPSDQWVAFEVSELEGLNAQSSIQVYNSAGAVLETITLRKGAGQYILDTRRFESGIYFYRLMGAKESFSGKFIIQH